MKNLSNTFRQEAYQQNMANVPIHLLQAMFVDNNGDTTYSYYCDQYEPVASGGQVYQPASFKVSLGEDYMENTPQVTLDFDAGDIQVVQKLRENDKPPVINISVVLSNSPDIAEIGPIEFAVSEFRAQSSALSLTLEVEPILNEPVPSTKFTPTIFPGLWKSIA